MASAALPTNRRTMASYQIGKQGRSSLSVERLRDSGLKALYMVFVVYFERALSFAMIADTQPCAIRVWLGLLETGRSIQGLNTHGPGARPGWWLKRLPSCGLPATCGPATTPPLTLVDLNGSFESGRTSLLVVEHVEVRVAPKRFGCCRVDVVSAPLAVRSGHDSACRCLAVSAGRSSPGRSSPGRSGLLQLFGDARSGSASHR